MQRKRPRGRSAAEQRNRSAPLHVWMAPAWQEIIWRAAQRSLAVMCPACWCSPGGLLALMGSANQVLIYLILKRASASRPSGGWSDDDFDVLCDGVVVGRIMKAVAVSVGMSWMWTLAFGYRLLPLACSAKN